LEAFIHIKVWTEASEDLGSISAFIALLIVEALNQNSTVKSLDVPKAVSTFAISNSSPVPSK